MRIYRYVLSPIILTIATASVCQANMISYMPEENNSLADFSLDNPVGQSQNWDLYRFIARRDILNPVAVHSGHSLGRLISSDAERYGELTKQVQNRQNVGLRRAFEQAVRHLGEERASRAQALIEEYKKLPRSQRAFDTLEKPREGEEDPLRKKTEDYHSSLPETAGLCAFASVSCLGLWLRRRK